MRLVSRALRHWRVRLWDALLVTLTLHVMQRAGLVMFMAIMKADGR